MNILFIVVDDLRPELGVYGVKQVKSPNIDKLAQNGIFFQKAYSQAPICGASRISVFNGYVCAFHENLRNSVKKEGTTPPRR